MAPVGCHACALQMAPAGLPCMRCTRCLVSLGAQMQLRQLQSLAAMRPIGCRACARLAAVHAPDWLPCMRRW
eukprot:352622-Chlamydomonas_euryale.AAC.2